MKARYVLPGLVILGLVAYAAIRSQTAAPFRKAYAPAPIAPLAAPPGITFQQVGRGGAGGPSRTRTRAVFANAAGMTLYIFDKDHADSGAACEAACLETWHPAIISGETAHVAPAWSAVTRSDGRRQWAYKGKPLYAFGGDSEVGDIKGDGVDGLWHAAVFGIVSDFQKPFGIAVESLVNAAGEVLVDSHGMPLYWSDGTEDSPAPCAPEACSDWVPVLAGALELPVGDFSIVEYDVGIRQWAFRDRPLFSYRGDKEVGDFRGIGISKHMQVATVASYFMPAGILLRSNRFGGINFATAAGMTLYFRNRAMPPQGHSLRAGTRGDPAVGRALGVKACDPACLVDWHPVSAPEDAIASGYWGIARRDDQSRQWAYRAFPVYTYGGDKAAGDMTGNDIFDFDPPNAPIDVGIPPAGSGLGFLSWHALVP